MAVIMDTVGLCSTSSKLISPQGALAPDPRYTLAHCGRHGAVPRILHARKSLWVGNFSLCGNFGIQLVGRVYGPCLYFPESDPSIFLTVLFIIVCV